MQWHWLMRKFPTVQKVDALVCNGSNPSLQLDFLPYCKKILKKIAKKIVQTRCTWQTSQQGVRQTDRQTDRNVKLKPRILGWNPFWSNILFFIYIQLMGVHPIIFVSNIFRNSHLILKCIHNQQLFWNSCWFFIHFWIKWELGKKSTQRWKNELTLEAKL